jgi:exodeoxyribonuclease III
MKIATYNVNGVNGRLPVLLRWLNEARPDVVCLQELKAPQEKFPINDIRKAGYGAVWRSSFLGRTRLAASDADIARHRKRGKSARPAR